MQACRGEAACAWEAVLRVVLGWALRRRARSHGCSYGCSHYRAYSSRQCCKGAAGGAGRHGA
eukprot:7042484-Prymnesium_polylepis.1